MRTLALLLLAAGLVIAQPTAPNWQPMTVTGPTAAEYGSTYYEVTSPGFLKVRVYSGSTTPGVHDHYEGVWSWWNLVDDPLCERNLGSKVCGLHQDQARHDGGLYFAQTGLNFYEWIASFGTVRVLQANDIRVIVEYVSVPRRFGVGSETPSPDLTITQQFTYLAPDTEYRRYQLAVTGGSDITNLQLMPTMVLSVADGAHAPDIVDSSSQSPPPWSLVTPDDNAAGDKSIAVTSSPGYSLDYVTGEQVPFPESAFFALHSSANWSRSKPSANMAQCTAGVCPPSALGAWPVYGGYRNMLIGQEIPTVSAGSDVVFHSYTVISSSLDVSSRPKAIALDAAYRGAAPTMTTGACITGTDIENCFDYARGAFRMTANNGVSFTTNAATRYPVFEIDAWTEAAPATITVGGVTKTKDTDYTALKLDSDTLLLQYRYEVAAATTWALAGEPIPAVSTTLVGIATLVGSAILR